MNKKIFIKNVDATKTIHRSIIFRNVQNRKKKAKKRKKNNRSPPPETKVPEKKSREFPLTKTRKSSVPANSLCGIAGCRSHLSWGGFINATALLVLVVRVECECERECECECECA